MVSLRRLLSDDQGGHRVHDGGDRGFLSALPSRVLSGGGLIRAAALAGLVLAAGWIGGNDGLDDTLDSMDDHGSALAVLRVASSPRPWLAPGVALPLVEPERVEVLVSPQPLSAIPRPDLRTLPPPADIAAAIRAYDWPAHEAERVAWCESRWPVVGADGCGDVYNRSTATGLFQIMRNIHSWRLASSESLFTLEINVRIAYQLWSEQGWMPWEASHDCHELH